MLSIFLPTLSWCAVVERTMGSWAWSDKDGGERGVSGAWHTIEVLLPIRVNGAFISLFLSGLFCFLGIGWALLWWIELLSKTGPLELWIFGYPSIPSLHSPVSFYGQADPKTSSEISPYRPPCFQCPISLISTPAPPPPSCSLLPHQSGYVMCLPTHANGDATNGGWDWCRWKGDASRSHLHLCRRCNCSRSAWESPAADDNHPQCDHSRL